MDGTLTQLAAHGILGPILVALWMAYVRLQKKLEETQDKRVSDAEGYASKMMLVAKAIDDNTSIQRQLVDEIQAQRRVP